MPRLAWMLVYLNIHSRHTGSQWSSSIRRGKTVFLFFVVLIDGRKLRETCTLTWPPPGWWRNQSGLWLPAAEPTYAAALGLQHGSRASSRLHWLSAGGLEWCFEFRSHTFFGHRKQETVPLESCGAFAEPEENKTKTAGKRERRIRMCMFRK